MITEQGLREQLLATVVVHERPDLQEKKEQLIVESARNRDTLYNLETKILQVIPFNRISSVRRSLPSQVHQQRIKYFFLGIIIVGRQHPGG